MKIFILFQFLTLAACALSPGDKNLRTYKLANADALIPGKHHKADVLETFGPPSEKIDTSTLSKAQKNSESWIYTEGGFQRISVFFSEDVMQSITWRVFEGEEEQDVDVAKKRYSKHWEIQVVPPKTPHTSPEFCKITSKALGISMDIRSSSKQVATIVRWNQKNGLPATPRSPWRSNICDFAI